MSFKNIPLLFLLLTTPAVVCSMDFEEGDMDFSSEGMGEDEFGAGAEDGGIDFGEDEASFGDSFGGDEGDMDSGGFDGSMDGGMDNFDEQGMDFGHQDSGMGDEMFAPAKQSRVSKMTRGVKRFSGSAARGIVGAATGHRRYEGETTGKFLGRAMGETLGRHTGTLKQKMSDAMERRKAKKAERRAAKANKRAHHPSMASGSHRSNSRFASLKNKLPKKSSVQKRNSKKMASRQASRQRAR